MPTQPVYWEEPMRRDLDAVVAESHTTDGILHIATDRTIFYPRGGGQPGDTGTMAFPDGPALQLIETIKTPDGKIWHRVEAATGSETEANIAEGAPVQLTLNWQQRYQYMRTHTAMHLLCAAVNAPVTGSSLHALRGRIDFDCETLDKESIQSQINEWVAQNAPVTTRWISEAELAANPAWTKSLTAPPAYSGESVRIVDIKDIDTQACGGTHIAQTGEIGAVRVVKIEKKGRQNRRVAIELQAEV